MPKADTELVVIEKTYELLIWTLKHIAKFPRNHRYGIGLRLELRLSEILDLLLRAKYTRDRLAFLQQANLDLELLRFQFRAVKDLKCLSLESYGSASRFVNEVGRLVGGWMRQVGGGHHAASQPPVAGTDELPQSAAGRPQSRTRQTPTH